MDLRVNNQECPKMGNAFPCEVSLKNKDLWDKFSEEGTEMIITKSGRRMFPTIQIDIKDLTENDLYFITLEMEPTSQYRFKYSTTEGWFPVSTEDTHISRKLYVHPQSPATGASWMSQTISFARLKLTNSITAPTGQILLSSMHRYQPKLKIVKVDDQRNYNWGCKVIVVFPETQFYAVTAYQNRKITFLKTNTNPFAKGFRRDGKAARKRRQLNKTETDVEQYSQDHSRRASSSCSSSVSECTDGLLNLFSHTSSSTDISSSYVATYQNVSSHNLTVSPYRPVFTVNSPYSFQNNHMSLLQNSSMYRYPYTYPSTSTITFPLYPHPDYYRPIQYRPVVPSYPCGYPYTFYTSTMWRPTLNVYPSSIPHTLARPQEETRIDNPSPKEEVEHPST